MLQPETIYHVYNHANGDENLFREEENYFYFLEKYQEYISPVADTFAWCLMPNHFHLMIRLKEEEELREIKTFQLSDLTGFENLSGLVQQHFSNFFNAYAKAYNKMYNRKGSLFQRPFKSKPVLSEAYFTQLILYIHQNPIKHGFASDPFDWPFSSIHHYTGGSEILLSNRNKVISDHRKEEVIGWFGGFDKMGEDHKRTWEIRSVFE